MFETVLSRIEDWSTFDGYSQDLSFTYGSLLCGLDGIPTAQGQAPSPPWCTDGLPMVAGSMPIVIPAEICDLRGKLIRDHDAGVVVPKVGGVTQHVLTETGSEVFGVMVAPNGDVELKHVGSERSEDQLASSQECTSCPPPCDDGHFVLHDFAEHQGHAWFFNRGSAPVNQPVARRK